MNRIIFFAIVFCLQSTISFSQNKPSNVGYPGTTPTGTATYPLNYNQGTIAMPSGYNYKRVYTPLVPMSSIPDFDNTKTSAILVNTTYKGGWNEPLMNIERNGLSYDLVKLYDYRYSDTSIDILPYADTFHSKFQATGFTQQRNYYLSKFPAEGFHAYSKTVSNHNGGRPNTLNYSPGRMMVGEKKGNTKRVYFNNTGEIYMLQHSYNSVCKTGTYPINTLIATEVQGQHNQTTINYSDKDGRLVCKRQYIGGTAGNSGWLTTYYVYDDLGRLTCTVPPKASQQLATNTCITNPYQLSFASFYDVHGNVFRNHIPGKSTDGEEMVYDRGGKVVMKRSGKQKDSVKWSFIVYDKLDRPVLVGLTSLTSGKTYWDGILAGTTSPSTGTTPYTSSLEYWLVNGCSGEDYPDTIPNCIIHQYNYYDTYNYDPAQSFSFNTSYTSNYLTGSGIEYPTPYLFAQGKLVASKSRILKNGIANTFNQDWITSVYYYDEKGRNIQTQTTTPWGATDVTTNQYNFSNNVVLTINKINGRPGSNKMLTNVFTKNTYALNSGRLVTVYQRIDNGIWMPISTLDFNDLGLTSVKSLGSTDWQNYTYNIRGQLKGINEDSLRRLVPSKNMSYFSSICYESGFDTVRYDGSISGYKWKSMSPEVRAYGYLFDNSGRLLSADYRDSSAAMTWNNTIRDFSVSNLSYDANGNIMTMKQRGYNTSLVASDVDKLTYTYDSGNQLQKVVDSGVASPIKVFENPNGTALDYTYDKNGNLTADANKGITQMGYDDYDQLVLIQKGTLGAIRNIYLANGTLLQKTVVGGGDSAVYNYCGGSAEVFKKDSLQYVMHAEGRARYNVADNSFKYDYFIRDHLGNVRSVKADSVYSMTAPPFVYNAGWELMSASTEEAIFDNIGQVRDGNPAGTPNDVMSAHMDGAYPDKRVAASLLLRGKSGDQFSVQAVGYYEDTSSANMNTYASSSAMLSAVAGALTSNIAVGGEGGAAITQTINNLLSGSNYGLYESIKNNATDPSYPRSYLNVLVFNDEFQLMPGQSQVVQLRGSASVWNGLNANTVIMNGNGYVISYLSHESNMPMYFDALTTRHFVGTLLEEQHYYPHGVAIEAATANTSLKKYLFQGNKMDDELGLNISDFNARKYDQQIGRFMAVDPLAQNNQEMLSPYHFCNNNPALYTDPSGLFSNNYDLENINARTKRVPDAFDMFVSRPQGSGGTSNMYIFFSMPGNRSGASAGGGGNSPAPNGDARKGTKYSTPKGTYLTEAQKAAEAKLQKQLKETSYLTKLDDLQKQVMSKIGEGIKDSWLASFNNYMDENHSISGEKDNGWLGSWNGKGGYEEYGYPTMMTTVTVLGTTVSMGASGLEMVNLRAAGQFTNAHLYKEIGMQSLGIYTMYDNSSNFGKAASNFNTGMDIIGTFQGNPISLINTTTAAYDFFYGDN